MTVSLVGGLDMAVFYQGMQRPFLAALSGGVKECDKVVHPTTKERHRAPRIHETQSQPLGWRDR